VARYAEFRSSRVLLTNASDIPTESAKCARARHRRSLNRNITLSELHPAASAGGIAAYPVENCVDFISTTTSNRSASGTGLRHKEMGASPYEGSRIA